MPESKDNNRAKIGQRLKEMREYLGLSQEEVAAALKIPRTAVSLIESGERKIEALELKQFADLYQQPVDYFMAGTTAENQSPKEVAYLARAATELTPEDRNELIRFAKFLKTKSK